MNAHDHEAEHPEEAGVPVPHDASAHARGVDPTAEPRFSEDEIQSFRSADRYAGAAIVLLMVAVFTVGLLLYTFVAIQVSM
jgi:hypothetical protein